VRSRLLLVPLIAMLVPACSNETLPLAPANETSILPDADFGEAPSFDSGDETDATTSEDATDTAVAPPDVMIDTPSIDGGAGPEVVTLGVTNKYRILGTIVTPTGPIKGEVLVEGTMITCVAASCAGEPGATGATVIDTKGIVFPGLIDAHNHTLYNVFDESDWKGDKLFTDANQWQGYASYGQFKRDKYNPMIAATTASPPGGNLDCEMNKYGEIKAMVAGTTAILGHHGSQNCFGTIIRTLGSGQGDFPTDDLISTNTLGVGSWPSATVWTSSNAYVIHVAEGISSTIKNEFQKLKTDGYLAAKTVIVHGTALDGTDFDDMKAVGAKLVWSPKSNVVLYGTTTNIPLARMKGIPIALAPDWSLSGSVNILDELRYAAAWDKAKWGGIFTAKELFEMVSIKPAQILAIDKWVGAIAVGKLADLMVIGGDGATPYDALLAVTPRDVRMTMVNGRILYGDEVLQKAAAGSCEGLSVCSRAKFACIAESGTTTKVTQTYFDIEKALTSFTYPLEAGVSTPAVPLAPLTTCPP